MSVSGSIGCPPPFSPGFLCSFLYQFKCTSSPIQADYVHFFSLTLLLRATAKERAVQRHVAFALLGARKELRNSCCESGTRHSPWSCENQTLCHNFAWKGLTLGARANLRWTADPTFWARSSPRELAPCLQAEGGTECPGQGHRSKALAAGGTQSQHSSPRLGFHLIVYVEIGKRPTCRWWYFPPFPGGRVCSRCFP